MSDDSPVKWIEISDPQALPRHPMVSVHMITYNHEPYIAEAIEGVLGQKTDFPIELIIGEDCSTDNTRAIVLEYQRQYPQLIRVLVPSRNVGMQVNGRRVLDACRGAFVAFCEGDDYWIDPKKLEKQVAFMERNPNLSMTFHAARIVYADGSGRSQTHRYRGRSKVSPKEVVLGGGSFYPTCSAMFRRAVFDDYPVFLRTAPVGDAMMALNAIMKGDVGYIDEIMAVYNSAVRGSWSERRAKAGLSEDLDFVARLRDIYTQFDKQTAYKFTSSVRQVNSGIILGFFVKALKMGQPCSRYDALRGQMIVRHKVRFHLRKLYYWLLRDFCE